MSIQIDTKIFELIIQYQYNNIKLSFIASGIKQSYVRLKGVVRLLDTYEKA